MNKRDAAIGLLAGLAGAGLLGTASLASGKVDEKDATEAITTWLNALQSGDAATVAKVLAPEFQLLRSDGTGYDSKSYLSDLPKQTGKPEISKLAFSSHKDMIVARYVLDVEQTIGGKPVQTVAPRLSVFRRRDKGWLMVAHANFAHIG